MVFCKGCLKKFSFIFLLGLLLLSQISFASYMEFLADGIFQSNVNVSNTLTATDIVVRDMLLVENSLGIGLDGVPSSALDVNGDIVSSQSICDGYGNCLDNITQIQSLVIPVYDVDPVDPIEGQIWLLRGE